MNLIKIIVNNKKIRVYELDNKDSILTRIASKFDSLPIYIHTDDNLDNLSETNNTIKITDILSVIKEDAKSSSDFSDFLEKNKDILTTLNIRKEVLPIWLAYNSEIEKEYSYNPGVLQIIGKKLVEYFLTISDFERFWRYEKKDVIKNLNFNLVNIKEKDDKNVKLFKVFDEIKEDDLRISTDFKPEKISLEITLDIADITMIELFNYIVVTEHIPFVKLGNYYKILKNFLPFDEWARETNSVGEVDQEEMILKLYRKNTVEHSKLKEYTDIKIRNNESGLTLVYTDISIQKGYLNKEQTLKQFEAIFPSLKLKYKSVIEKQVSGYFLYPDDRINSYVFSDLVMNDKIFSSLININESEKATKKKNEEGQGWLYLYFDHLNTGIITASVSQKFSNSSEPELRNEDPEIFPPGSPYIKIRVAKAKNKEAINVFKNIFSKLLYLYSEKYNDIVLIYQEFIPTFGIVKETVLKDVAKKDRELMVENYSRSCQGKRMPTIVTKEEAEEHAEQGGQYMLFPRNQQEEEPNYESDGKGQKYYICLNDEYSYPGLQENKLRNADKYPYNPCCFTQDQSSDKKYRAYYYNEVKGEKGGKQQDLIKSNKFLSMDKHGELSSDLQNFFKILDTDINYKFIRLGMNRGYNSFIEAVMVGLYDQTNILEDDSSSSRLEKIVEMRKKFSDKTIYPLAKQCNYDLSSKQLLENISSEETYFDPKLYIQILEEYFDCNIFIFNETQMVKPRYIQGYYRPLRKAKNIFIYEHMGSESDRAKYPQCELIIRWNVKKSTDTQYSFEQTEYVSETVKKIFDMTNQTYVLEDRIFPIEFPIKKEDIELLSQSVDSFGKTRCVNVKYKGTVINVFTSPIQPLRLRIRELKTENIPGELAFDLLKYLGAEIKSQTVIGTACREINALLGNVKISIPVNEDVYEGINIEKSGLHYLENIDSALVVYNKNKKLARYITEYMFWLFSTYLNKEGVETITDKILAKFFKEFIVIDEKFEYGNVPKTFSKNSGVMKNGKLVVKNEETMKRLAYVLKLYTVRDLKTLLDYHSKKVITHYYVDITDFDSNPKQILIQGDNVVEKIIQESNFSYIINRGITNDYKTPYFFKNEHVEDTVFLAQNVDSLEKAISLGLIWNKKKVNEGVYIENITSKQYSFTLYSYINPDDITEKRVVGKKESGGEIRVIGYKKKGKAYFTVLFKLE
jgi:hypothetical protein